MTILFKDCYNLLGKGVLHRAIIGSVSGEALADTRTSVAHTTVRALGSPTNSGRSDELVCKQSVEVVQVIAHIQDDLGDSISVAAVDDLLAG